MKNFFLFNLLFLVLISCGSNDSAIVTTDNKKNTLYYDQASGFHIPKKVKVNKYASNLYQFPGTRIFFQKPNRFDFVDQKRRLQKGDDNYLTAFEYPKSSFLEDKYYLTQEYKSAQYKNAIFFEQDVKIGSYDGYFICGAGSKSGYVQLILLFGDESFSAVIIGEVESTNIITINEITESLLTSFVNKKVEPDFSLFKNFDIDLSGSEFQFNNFFNGSFCYSKDSTEDLSKKTMVDFFSITSMPHFINEKEAHDVFNATVEQLKLTGFNIKSIQYNDLKMNELDGYQLNANGIGEQGSIDLTCYAFNHDDGAIVVSILVPNNNSKTKKEIDKIIGSMKIKNSR